MAIQYDFSCTKCNYHVQLKIGLTRMQSYKNDPDVELAKCNNCKTLSTTNNKHCITCNAKAETGKWFSRKTGFKILDIRVKEDNISCPNCDFGSILAMPILFID